MKHLLSIFASVALIGAGLPSPPAPYLPVPKGAAVILDTGSTNTAAYRIVVAQSGAATWIFQQGRSSTTQLPADLTSRFFDDLRAGMPLSKLAIAPCMKSASFGTSRFVWWRGQRSPDITCPGAAAIEHDADAIARALFGNPAPPKGMGAAHTIAPLPNEPRIPLPAPSPTGSR